MTESDKINRRWGQNNFSKPWVLSQVSNGSFLEDLNTCFDYETLKQFPGFGKIITPKWFDFDNFQKYLKLELLHYLQFYWKIHVTVITVQFVFGEILVFSFARLRPITSGTQPLMPLSMSTGLWAASRDWCVRQAGKGVSTLRLTNIAGWKMGPFQDVFPIENGDIS